MEGKENGLLKKKNSFKLKIKKINIIIINFKALKSLNDEKLL